MQKKFSPTASGRMRVSSPILVQHLLSLLVPQMFSANQCDQHPISVSWWWSIHGCKQCALTHKKKMGHFEEKVGQSGWSFGGEGGTIWELGGHLEEKVGLTGS